MKKLLSAILPALGIILSMNCALGQNYYDYTINQYDINLNFKKDNTVNVSEKINAAYYGKGNSITRTFHTTNTPHFRDLSNIKTNDIHVINNEEDGIKTIKIVDTKAPKESEKDFSFNYDLSYGNSLYSQDFSYDIIDGTWEGEIDKVNFKITMPYNLKRKNVEFISSYSGIINNSDLHYNIIDNKVKGYYSKPLLPDEKLTIHITPKKQKRWFTAKPNQLVLNNLKNEKITLHVNDEVLIRLDSNPTTGFSWQMSVDPENENVVRISEENYIPNNQDSAFCGGGGISEFKVKALNKGNATITGVYIRPWMQYEDTGNNSVQYSVEVK